MLINQSLNLALQQLLERDEKIICLGEDIEGSYGGAFKVTKNLSSKFPGRVRNTPISESGIIGFSTGLSMMGYKPITEIMFGDFILLGADQIINHLSKFHLLHHGDLKPKNIVIRTPMGGGRGYGPTHSQSLEKHFMGVPGIKLVALNIFTDAGKLLKHAIQSEYPIIFIENKMLYGHPNHWSDIPSEALLQESDGLFPEYSYCPIKHKSPDFSMVTYGGMSKIGYDVINQLWNNEHVAGELFIPSQIPNWNQEKLIQSVIKTKFLIVLEEGQVTMGFSAEVISSLHSKCSFKSYRIGAKTNEVIPCSRNLENRVLPTTTSVYKQVINFLEANL